MDVKQILRLSLQSLIKNKIRALQSTVIMIIGLTAVFTVVYIAQGLLNQIKMQVSNYNSGTIWVNVFERADTYSRDTLTNKDWRRLVQENPNLIDAVSPMIYVFDFVDGCTYNGKLYNSTDISVNGVNEDFARINTALRIEQGRFLHNMDVEREQNVCVVGNTVAEKIMGGSALGQTVKIAGENFYVVGVLQEIDLDSENWNNVLLIPSSTALKITGADFRPETFGGTGAYYSSYFVNVVNTENVTEASQAIRAMLQEHLHDTDVANITALDWQGKQMSYGLSLMFAPFVLFVFIILIVGGVSIMNTMVAFVTERTKEIGIRKAFGASHIDIKRQFLAESICISLTGSMVAIILALPVCYFICSILHLPIDVAGIPLLPLISTLLVAIGTGIVFGTYPAQQAAKMEIVDAINSD